MFPINLPALKRVGERAIADHPGVAKGWLKCDAAGNISVSHNVTSIADTGTGVVDVTWDVDFATSDYVVNVTPEVTVGVMGTVESTSSAPAAGTTRISTYNTAGSFVDPANYHIAAFGDQ